MAKMQACPSMIKTGCWVTKTDKNSIAKAGLAISRHFYCQINNQSPDIEMISRPKSLGLKAG
jgi:hypothetical protein